MEQRKEKGNKSKEMRRKKGRKGGRKDGKADRE